MLSSHKNKAVIAACDYRLKTIKNQAKISQKSPQVVKHVVKGEKMGLFNPRSREEQAHYVYCGNARFQEDLRDK